MEKESSERETDGVTDAGEENPEGDVFSGRPSSPAEGGLRETGRTEEGYEQPVLEEDITAHLKHDPQDTPNLAAPQDPGAGEAEDCETAEAKEEDEEEEEEVEEEEEDEEEEAAASLRRDGVDQRAAGHEETEIMDEDEEDGQEESQNEDARDEHMNGESGWRSSSGNGKRCRSRNSGGGPPPSEPSGHLSSSAISSSSIQKGSLFSGGGRHKQTRRRNHHHHQGRGRRRTGNQLASAFRELLSDSLGTWCISCVHMVIELIVTLTHHCGVGVEAGGVAMYGFAARLFAKVTDVPGMKEDARRVLEWTRGTGAALVDKSARAAECVKQASLSCFGLFCTLALLGFHWARGALVRLGGERGKRCWRATQDSRLWRRAASLLERVGAWFRRSDRGPASGPESPGRAGRWLPGQELERLLALALVPEDELDPFTVLGVEVHATEAELKRAYRQLAVQVHPDKNKHPRAGEAFKVLRAAWDVVSNPDTRREYELKRMAASELSKSMNEFLTKLQDDLKEAMNTMMCTKCEGKHKRFEMDRDPAEARFCAECSRRHSAEEGDLWAESSMLGLRITYFACMDGKVYDITEWAGCQRIGISPDTHRVPYHISFGSKNNSTSTRQRTPSEHPPGPSNPADLQDFFNRIFQGGPATDMAANGGFFPPGPPHSHPPGAAGPRFTPPPPPPTGFFMPPGGPPRPEPSETFAAGEGSKPPRRRKKVRKPFQR